MFNRLIRRLCSQCGVRPVTTPGVHVCDQCATLNLLAWLNEPILCPRCNTEMPVPLYERGVCPNCGYVEEPDND